MSPIDGRAIGSVREGDDAVAAAAMAAAAAGFARWSATPIEIRVLALERASDLLEARRGRLIALLQSEGGKTLDDAVAEVREAVDFCRYYAAEARRSLQPESMPGPTGECNELSLSRPRGLRLHQSMELSVGDLPRPGERRAGCRQYGGGEAGRADSADRGGSRSHSARGWHTGNALHLVPGDGKAGAALVADPRVAGVAFTGSTEVARAINRALAAKEARSCR